MKKLLLLLLFPISAFAQYGDVRIDSAGNVINTAPINYHTGQLKLNNFEVIPQGGTAGLVLTKNSSTSYDMSWQPGAGGGGGEVPLTFDMSLLRVVNTIHLVNDNATPGNSMYYGTNAGGTKGFFALPAGGGGSGTVTNVATGAGLTGGPITTTGTIDLANVSAVTNQWVDSVVGNVLHLSQPGFPNLSGNIAVSQMNSGTGATSTTAWFGDGTWKSVATGTGLGIGSIGFTVDGAGAEIAVGVKGYFTVDYTGTITGWSITADGTSPTCTIDVWKIGTGTALPTVANTIMGTKPALSTGNAKRSTTMTGWTTSFTAGDIFGFNVDSLTTATKLTFELETTR